VQFPTDRGPRGRARQRRRQVRDRTGGQARRGGEDQGRRRQRHGFDDGEALLARDGEYLRNALDEVRRALVAAGLEADVGASGSHHNPLLIVGDVYRGGSRSPIRPASWSDSPSSCGRSTGACSTTLHSGSTDRTPLTYASCNTHITCCSTACSDHVVSVGSEVERSADAEVRFASHVDA
jgi:hypothetical protein